MRQILGRHKWLWLAALALAALSIFAACGGGGGPTGTPGGTTPPPNQLRLGLLTCLTGSLAPFGPDFVNSSNLAIEHINAEAAGGVLGQPITARIGDDQTLPEAGVAEARRLVDIEKVDVLIGTCASGVTVPVAESVTVPGKILQISFASTSPALTTVDDNDYLFRTPISDAAQGVILARLVKDELGFNSVCTMFVNNAYGQGLTDKFAETYEAAGGTVTAQVSHTAETAPSYASELKKCTAGDPEALVAISYVEGQADVYLKEAVEGGLVDNFVFVDGTKSDSMFKTLGWDTFDGMKGTAPGALETEFGTTFDEAFKTKYGYLYQTPFNRETYDAVVIAALAAEKAGSTDPTAIRDALRDVANAPGKVFGPGADQVAAALKAVRNGEDIDYQGASGAIEFDENGDVLVGAIEVWQVDAANEKLVTIERFKVDLSTGEVTQIEG
ncbi:MAG: ABC transporter substrate-binding protein [Chloroflexi bacterium]|nr:ABC transporter substrate-binding protein [Chloroflexota bacterium]